MPYIKKDDRGRVDDKLVEFYRYLSNMSMKEFAGHLNYVIFKTVKIWIDKNGKSYFSFATIMGTLICCVLEIYRRLIAPYEDKKIRENGDV